MPVLQGNKEGYKDIALFRIVGGEAMVDGWIKLYRKLLEKPIWKKPPICGRLDLKNGITLCEKCHKTRHKKVVE
jgi:hypothetical protein